MTERTAYPVLSQTPLDPARRRRFGRALTKTLNPPVTPPGSALVLQVEERFTVVPSLRAAGRLLPRTTAIVVVSLCPTPITVQVTLPAGREDAHFAIDASFECRVTDASLCLLFGCWDVWPALWRYITEDPAVGRLATADFAGDLDWIGQRISARCLSRGRISPPYVPGMVCTLTELAARARPGSQPATTEPDNLPPGIRRRESDDDYYRSWDG